MYSLNILYTFLLWKYDFNSYSCGLTEDMAFYQTILVWSVCWFCHLPLMGACVWFPCSKLWIILFLRGFFLELEIMCARYHSKYQIVSIVSNVPAMIVTMNMYIAFSFFWIISLGIIPRSNIAESRSIKN